MFDRRNMAKTLGAGAAGGLALARSLEAEAAPAAARASEAPGPYVRPWGPHNEKHAGSQNIVAVSNDYFVSPQTAASPPAEG